MKIDIVKQIESKLPEFKHVMPGGELDFYGFSSIIAAKLGLKSPPFSYGGWMHGWDMLPLQDINQLLVEYDPKKIFFVITEEQVEFLNSRNIHNVKAGGLPFVYADDTEIERIPRSLLVMPGHFTAHSVDTLHYAREEYIEYIKNFSGNFDHVVFCLNQECIRQGHWLKELEKAGIPYVAGADSRDVNSFARIKTIMSHFESMTTNQIGSHVLYASLCGCKVSIAEGFSYEEKHIGDKHVEKLKDLLENVMTIDNLKKWYPQFYVEPDKATRNIEWAKEQSGIKNMLVPEQIAKLLGWNKCCVQKYGKYAMALAQTQSRQICRRCCLHLMKSLFGLMLNLNK